VGQVFNIGAREEISILSLAQRVIEVLESSSQITLVPYEQVYASGFEDMARRVPDTRRIQQAVGWKAERTLDDIILDVADSLKA
jgi:UDP-glucose 4-epimerase